MFEACLMSLHICRHGCSYSIPVSDALRVVQVLQTLKSSERQKLSTLQLRQKARDFALKTIEQQKAGFKRFGVWADWEEPYVTLQPEYEAAQLGVFGKVRGGACLVLYAMFGEVWPCRDVLAACM